MTSHKVTPSHNPMIDNANSPSNQVESPIKQNGQHNSDSIRINVEQDAPEGEINTDADNENSMKIEDILNGMNDENTPIE